MAAAKALIMTGPLAGKNKAQQDFCIEYTRHRMVTWAAREQRGGNLPFMPDTDIKSIWAEVALFKGWLKKDRTGLTATGYAAAAAFLRR